MTNDPLAALFDSIGDGLVTVDAQACVTGMNQHAQEFTGVPLEKARGRKADEIVRVVSSTDRAPLAALLPEALAGGMVARQPGTALIVSQDGTERPVLDIAVTREGGAAILVLRDESRARTAEAQRAQAAVTERVAAMGTLSGGLAHEINNPLASVLANLALLQAELPKLLPGSERARELLEAVAEAQRSGERVAQIVRGLRVFSRGVDEGRRPLEVARVAEQVLNLLANELRHRARVVRDFQPVSPVLATEAHLGQLFVNLLLNAAQSIPEGDADRNEVRVAVRPGGPGEVVVEVADTGAGMTPDVLSRAFDPFFTTRPVGGGAGLGLSMCHGIVKSLGGTISAKSAPGKGSVFRVTLPAAPETQPEAAPAKPGKRGRILLVEDDPLVARALRRTLAREHDVIFAEGGRAALEALEREEFDLVISDLMMPEMTGMELHAELSRTRPEVAKRMVFLSGGAFTDAAREFLRGLPNLKLEKPFDPQQLRETIRRLLGG